MTVEALSGQMWSAKLYQCAEGHTDGDASLIGRHIATRGYLALACAAAQFEALKSVFGALVTALVVPVKPIVGFVGPTSWNDYMIQHVSASHVGRYIHRAVGQSLGSGYLTTKGMLMPISTLKEHNIHFMGTLLRTKSSAKSFFKSTAGKWTLAAGTLGGVVAALWCFSRLWASESQGVVFLYPRKLVVDAFGENLRTPRASGFWPRYEMTEEKETRQQSVCAQSRDEDAECKSIGCSLSRLKELKVTRGSDHPWLQWLFPKTVQSFSVANESEPKARCWNSWYEDISIDWGDVRAQNLEGAKEALEVKFPERRVTLSPWTTNTTWHTHPAVIF